MAKVEVQRLNPVYVTENGDVGGVVADVNLVPPVGYARWRAFHNLHSENVSILAPSNEIYRYTVEDGGGTARSTYHNPLNSGKLDDNQSILSSATSTETSATSSFSADSSGTVTVTRNGKPATGVTVPSFDGINYDGTALTAIVVTATEGAGLEEGDVISFPCTTATGLTVSITVAEDDLQLGAGLNILKATTMAVAAIVPANHIVQIPSFSTVQILATDGGNDGFGVLYFG
tara:strand:+ start:978 stop:1673 length:696 start_codon:yes stop_codon:yes gene_type:complete